jgi:putative resolvase
MQSSIASARRSALRWWKAGLIKGYQSPTGTIIVTVEPPKEAHVLQRVAIYARVWSHEHRPNLERQMERLEDDCAAKGYQIVTAVNDAPPKFLARLADPSITTIVVEHQDRATRFEFRYLEPLPGLAGRRIEVVNLAENDREDEAFRQKSSLIYSFAARLYGKPRAKRKTEAIAQQLKAEEGS